MRRWRVADIPRGLALIEGAASSIGDGGADRTRLQGIA